MPIYEYECPVCGVFDVIQKADAKPLKAKPECDNKDCPKCAKRLISTSAFHLKGTGWYKSDYASSSSSSGGKKVKKDGEGTSDQSSSTEKSEKKADSSSDSGGKKKGPCGSGCGCH
jgi:putative FmdB family regulatory protein